MKQRSGESGVLRANTFRYHDFEVSWVGPAPRDLVCLGSISGDLLFAKPTGEPVYKLDRVSPSGAAVNGAAFIGDTRIAVSTPSEIIFRTDRGGKTLVARFPAGAHGVMATKTGYFVAPLGPEGLMLVKTEGGADESVTVIRGSKELNFYRVISVPSEETEILVCAARADGVSINLLMSGEAGIATFPMLDMIDVCSLDLATRSVLALSSDGTMAFFRDILSDQDPVTFKFDEIEGTAYRLLYTRENVFLLTSVKMYQMSWPAKDRATTLPSLVRNIEFGAADCNLVGNREYLGLVMPGGYLPIELRQLVLDTSTGGPWWQTSRRRKISRTGGARQHWLKLQGWSTLDRIRKAGHRKSAIAFTDVNRLAKPKPSSTRMSRVGLSSRKQQLSLS